MRRKARRERRAVVWVGESALTVREAGPGCRSGPMRSIRVTAASIASKFVLRFLDDRDPAEITSVQLSIQKCPSSSNGRSEEGTDAREEDREEGCEEAGEEGREEEDREEVVPA